jgi:hypothetical protein
MIMQMTSHCALSGDCKSTDEESMTASLTCDIVQGQTVERTKHYYFMQQAIGRTCVFFFAFLLHFSEAVAC